MLWAGFSTILQDRYWLLCTLHGSLFSLLLDQVDPLGDLLVMLQLRQLRPVQVLGDLPHAPVGLVEIQHLAVGLLPAQQLCRFHLLMRPQW
jgi:hypothetical protein